MVTSTSSHTNNGSHNGKQDNSGWYNDNTFYGKFFGLILVDARKKTNTRDMQTNGESDFATVFWRKFYKKKTSNKKRENTRNITKQKKTNDEHGSHTGNTGFKKWMRFEIL